MILFFRQYYIPIPSFVVPLLPPNPGMGDGHHKPSLAIVFSSLSTTPCFLSILPIQDLALGLDLCLEDPTWSFVVGLGFLLKQQQNYLLVVIYHLQTSLLSFIEPIYIPSRSWPWPLSAGSHLVLCCQSWFPPETTTKLSFSRYLPFANFSVIIHWTHLHTFLLSALTSVCRIPPGPLLSVLLSSWNNNKTIF